MAHAKDRERLLRNEFLSELSRSFSPCHDLCLACILVRSYLRADPMMRLSQQAVVHDKLAKGAKGVNPRLRDKRRAGFVPR